MKDLKEERAIQSGIQKACQLVCSRSAQHLHGIYPQTSRTKYATCMQNNCSHQIIKAKCKESTTSIARVIPQGQLFISSN
ncbi:hypothetical protein Y1Q_0014436 [Alligator mississippiensis]|uniref:Uncharacterized protein n=1 Tax=Alligator mississippiensis TaxID=8496 RepID=A0A151PD15_ALLMI|nr:hypothetical protein Y1Q_0014436 [Alligator mississippiensis]